MAFQYRSGRIDFHRATGQKQRRRTLVEFSGRVANPEAMLKGFHVEFENGQAFDKPLHELEIDLDVQINTDPHDTRHNRSVFVTGDFGIRDASGNFDDPYSGWIEYFVIADVSGG